MKSISIKQNDFLNYIQSKNSANSINNEKTGLIEAENLLKGYVNNLVKQSVVEFNVEERKNLLLKRKKHGYGGSSNNLRVKRKRGIMKKKDNDDNKLQRRMSYNVDNKSRVKFDEIYKKEKKIEINEKKKEKHESDDNNNNVDSSKRIFQRKNKIFKTQKPEKFFEPKSPKSPKRNYKIKPKTKNSFNSVKTHLTSPGKNNKMKNSLELEEHYLKKSTNREGKKELFSLLKKPQYFEGESDISESIINEDNIIYLSGLSNKNILQLNEIKKELHKTLIGKKKSIEKESTFKSYLDDEENSKIKKSTINITEINQDDKEKYRILTRKGYVYDSFDDEEIFDEREIYSHIHPDSFFIIILDFFILISVLYNLVSIPLFLGYNNIYCHYGNYFTFEHVIENIIDAFFIIDIFIKFFTGYYNFDEVLINDYKSIAKHYLKTWFFIDFISAIPVKTIIIISHKDCYDNGYLTTSLYNGHFYYLFLLLRLFKAFQVISKNQFLKLIENELSRFNNFNSYGRLLISCIIFFISLHIVACILIFIGKNEYPNWIVYFNHHNKSFLELYLVAIYYTITTLTTVGYGDLSCVTTVEKLFGLLMEIVGILAYSWALTAMSNYVKIENDKHIEFRKKCKILASIKLSHPQLSDDLYERTVRFLKYKHDSDQKDNHILFDELPIALRNSLLYEMYKPIINSFNFFKNFTNSDFIVKVIIAFKPILALKNDILIKEGDFIEDIIFIKKGKLSLELPIDFGSPKSRTVRRDSLLGIRRSTIFFNTFQRENTVSPDLITNIFKTKSNTNDKKTKNLFNSLTQNLSKLQTEKTNVNNTENIQNFKILELRKNEHFGDILMFLNQRSPLSLKVKTKKAELFFLNKADAISISTSYPQYWKRINKKSLFNMEQIKRLTNKIIRIISNSHGIVQTNKKSLKQSSSVISDTNYEFVEEGDSDLKTIPSISESEIEDTLYNNNMANEQEENENNDENGDDNNIENNNSNNENLNEAISNLEHYQSLKTIVEDEANSSKNSSYSSKKLESLNSEISKSQKLTELNTMKYNFQSSSKNSSSLSEESGFEMKKKSVRTKKTENNSYDDTLRNKVTKIMSITPYNKEEINNEIYPEEIFVTTGGTNTNYLINNNIFHPIISDNISICSTEISFSINSEYENIDELSDHIYSKDNNLRKKVKKYIKEMINFKNQTFMTKSSFTGTIKDSVIKNNFSISKHHHHLHNNIKSAYRRTPSETKKTSTIKHFGSGYGFNIQKTRTSNNKLLSSDHLRNNYNRNNSGQFSNVKVNKLLGYEETEKSIININNNKLSNKNNILDVIGHNIEKNVMNLNNPEQFYSEFFLKFMNKKKGKDSNPEINKEEQDFINKIERKATVTIVRDKGFKNNKPKN